MKKGSSLEIKCHAYYFITTPLLSRGHGGNPGGGPGGDREEREQPGAQVLGQQGRGRAREHGRLLVSQQKVNLNFLI